MTGIEPPTSSALSSEPPLEQAGTTRIDATAHTAIREKGNERTPTVCTSGWHAHRHVERRHVEFWAIDHPRLRSGPRRRDGDHRRRPLRRSGRHHHRRRECTARADHPQRARDARPARHRRAGPLRAAIGRWSSRPTSHRSSTASRGLDGADLPAPTTPLDGTDAVAFIVDTCRATEGIWLVPVGPLTNIALALRAAPDLAGRIAGISLMGGGTFGNRNAVGEFNIWADPEAADDRVRLGRPAGDGRPRRDAPVPGDAGAHRTGAGDRRSARRGARRPVRLLLRHVSRAATTRARSTAPPVHDPLAVLALTHPDVFERVERHVAIETAGDAHPRHDRDRRAAPRRASGAELLRCSSMSTPTPRSTSSSTPSPTSPADPTRTRDGCAYCRPACVLP